MRGNQFGNIFCLYTFGESHGPALGAVIEGCPAGVIWEQEMLNRFLDRRRPGRSPLTSGRRESDQAEVLSGVYGNRTLGTPIAAVVRSQDARPQDYSPEALQTRQGHATDLWHDKYGHSDPRGSGRASGRETVSRVIGGAVARMFVTQMYPEAQVIGFVSRVGFVGMTDSDCMDAAEALEGDPWNVDEFSVRCPSQSKNEEIETLLKSAQETGESYGGAAFMRIVGLPRGLGQPVFAKLKSEFASAFMSIGATAGVEFGAGFEAAQSSGREFHNNRQDYGGIRGGISTGDPITLRVAFKPTSTRGTMAKEGRHDPCIVPRAIPVLEAMAWLVLADQILLARLDRV
ncbi:MAG: chorismate synthase [Bdellovibrionales bacterium]